jgi:hypothetical protein
METEKNDLFGYLKYYEKNHNLILLKDEKKILIDNILYFFDNCEVLDENNCIIGHYIPETRNIEWITFQEMIRHTEK